MTQGFDEFKEYHNANYHDGDSHFDERTYKKSNGDDFDYSFVQDCYDHFEAGAASRQAEIDSLRIELDGANERAVMILNHKNKMVDKMQAEIDDLQKRIDLALNHTINHGGYDDLTHIINILKGVVE